MAKILIVEDDLMVAHMVLDWVKSEHHVGEVVHDGLEGHDRLKYYNYDLAILDWQLPGMTGIEICRQYRQEGGSIPILMLTGQNTMDDKEIGFDAGADDYLTKPFDLRELRARVRALLRRPSEVVPALVGSSAVTLDYKGYSLVRDGEKIKLLPKEFAVLEFLLRHPGQFFTPDQILNQVWNSDSDSTVDALRACIKRLRQRIDKDGAPSMIHTSRGLGYKFELPS
ncbi:MAG: response regulator transcription factor [Cyanobacteria bacterium SZAS-4]|nr:response regulator transcription factor [Cyanobacteria bacterium SZAS-4]